MKRRMPSNGPLLYTSLRLYRLLLRVYPRRFRQSYQDQMEQAFLDLWRDAVQEGRMAFCSLWIVTMQDLLCSLFRERSFGGSMARNVAVIGCVLAILFGYMVQAQAQLTVSAAATDPVAGWQRIELGDDDRTLWVSPTPSLTSDDIQGVQSLTRADGSTVVEIQFTEDGSEKMRELSAAQIDRPIAMLFDGELISAPVVRSLIDGGQVVISGGGPNGLTLDQIQRILASVNE